MDFPVSAITKPIIGKLIALQSFFFARPRLDIDLRNNQDGLYGQRSLGPSSKQDHAEPIPVPYAKYDFEFYWNYKLRIKNNSSKTAYNIKIEKIHKTAIDYLEKLDDIASLKDGDVIELDYKLKFRSSKNGREAKKFLSHFPGHLEKVEILISYTNESRKKFYTRFVATPEMKTNEHLLRRPK
ncbi:hypothetical protein [Marinoscillum pacificum]|uniref:hypothetical protein n=1 Tax=Marinoscillum pacificum TaxID=392723 RepID=UPI002157DF62|nr:hypothetical protein [Marinoscillum pacificum]